MNAVLALLFLLRYSFFYVADPSELTLWELVLRNKRIVTREEIEAKKAAAENTAKEAEALRIQSESANDDFSDLFNDGGNTNSVFHNQSRNDEAPDLFGSSDPLMTNSGGKRLFAKLGCFTSPEKVFELLFDRIVNIVS